MSRKRPKQQLTGRAAVNLLERCLALSAMAEQRIDDAKVTWFAYFDNEKAVWSGAGCPDDFAHAATFALTGSDGERFLDWCANQRHFWLLCESGLEDIEAHCSAQNDRTLLRKASEYT